MKKIHLLYGKLLGDRGIGSLPVQTDAGNLDCVGLAPLQAFGTHFQTVLVFFQDLQSRALAVFIDQSDFYLLELDAGEEIDLQFFVFSVVLDLLDEQFGLRCFEGAGDAAILAALSKADALTPDLLEEHMKSFTDAFGAKAEKILAISAQTGQGLDELKTTLKSLIDAHSADTVVYESEFDPMERLAQELPFTVEKTDEGEYDVYGPKIDKLMGYTNLDDEKGFAFFQSFLVKEGIITELKRQGMVEGDTVNVGGYVFEYFE